MMSQNHHQTNQNQNENDEISCCESDDEYTKTKDSKIRKKVKESNIHNENQNENGDGDAGNEMLNKKYKDKSVAASTNGYRNDELPSSSSAGGGDNLSPMSQYNEERMKRKLQFFFMNPIEKWQARKQFPYKFVIQVVKIVLVTMQLCLFAHSRYNHINYTWDNRIAFSHLFLRGWDRSMEIESYPPSSGPLAIYEKSDFFNTIDYAVIGYSNLTRAIGSYSYPTEDNNMAPMKLCLYVYREGTIFGFNESYIFNPEIDRTCVSLTHNMTEIGTRKYLESQGFDFKFSALVKATLKFVIKTVNFKPYGLLTTPDCYKFDITILFDNRDHDGQMLIALEADALRLHCKGDIQYLTDTKYDAILRSILNIFVIIICLLSLSLCARAIYRAQLLRKQTTNFFRVVYKRELICQEKMEFVNFWYIMIICNDVLLIIGSALKEQIERKFLVMDGWDVCSVFLGIGNLLVWFGVLRYLGFFKTYNVVILTLKKAAPKIMRFLLCALLIYGGFTFCGWLILGPYHVKFRSLSMTSECLFSLINGDDMFATFTTLSTKSNLLWWFCRIYLYTFISLYIYVVLSLFISVIMDSYDTIKRYYREGFPQSGLRQFVGSSSPEDFSSGVFQTNFEGFDIESSQSFKDYMKDTFCCCRKQNEVPGPTGYISLNQNK